MAASKFNGVCVLIASVLVAAAIVYHGRVATPQPGALQAGRYQLAASDKSVVVIDTVDGKVITEKRW